MKVYVICFKILSTQGNLNDHINSVHKKALKWLHCESRFGYSRIGSDDATYKNKCDICTKAFKS